MLSGTTPSQLQQIMHSSTILHVSDPDVKKEITLQAFINQHGITHAPYFLANLYFGAHEKTSIVNVFYQTLVDRVKRNPDDIRTQKNLVDFENESGWWRNRISGMLHHLERIDFDKETIAPKHLETIVLGIAWLESMIRQL